MPESTKHSSHTQPPGTTSGPPDVMLTTARVPLWVTLVARWAGKVPLKLCVAVVALSLYAQEFFPLSPFPMYASPTPKTWIVYVSDGQDQPIALQDRTNLRTARIKKVYAQRLLQAQKARPNTPHARDAAKRAAAESTLEFAYRESGKLGPTLPPALRLWHLQITKSAKGVDFEPSLLGEYRRP